MIRYAILNGYNHSIDDAQNELCKNVNDFVKLGWVLHGSMTVTEVTFAPPIQPKFLFSQPVTKEIVGYGESE